MRGLGKQVPIHDLKGGMWPDKDERRIPNRAFKSLVNVEYNKQGKLIKSKGYDDLGSVCAGAVKDIQRILDSGLAQVGYLIAEETARFVSDLTGAPAQDHSFSKARSKFLKDGSDRYFYVSDNGTGDVRSLKKWYYSSPYGIEIAAGIPIPDMTYASSFFSEVLTGAGVNPCLYTNAFDSGNDDVSLQLDLDHADNLLYMLCPSEHPILKMSGTFKEIWVPVKNYNLADFVADNFISCTIEGTKVDGTSGTETIVGVNSLGTGLLCIKFTFVNEYKYLDPSNPLKITLFPSTPTAGKYVQFYRAKPFLIHGDGDSQGHTIKINTSGTVETLYSDRELNLGFVTDKFILDRPYTQNFSWVSSTGLLGNMGDPSYTAEADKYDWTDGISISIAELWDHLINGNETQLIDIESLQYGRSLVGGGTIYRAASFKKTRLIQYKDYGFEKSGKFGVYVSIPCSQIQDCLSDAELSATPMPTDANNPDALNPLMNSLFYHRSRAFMLARIADANGIISTYIRWSEVDIYDYWDPLNEMFIPDNIIECRPLREDMFLAFSRTRTYRIDPSGTSFEWVKIADVGIGSLSLASSIGTTTATQLSCATNEAIFWVNDFGAYKFDGASATLIPASLNILSMIQAAIANDGIMMVSERDQSIWLSWSGQVLVFDLVNQAISSQSRSHTILSISSDGSTIYFGYSGGIAQRSADWSENSTPLTSTIITKKFAANDLSRIQLFYFGLTYRVKASGSLSLSFEFSTGAIVTKTIDLTQGSYDLNTVLLDVYGEGDWFQLTITHDDNEDFEIVDYVIGARPINLVFMEASSNA